MPPVGRRGRIPSDPGGSPGGARPDVVRPARDRWGRDRRRDRCARGARGVVRRARRRRRLRLRDVQRVVEAHPRRAPLPAPRRRGARPRGAPRAAHADRPGRAAPRAPASLPAAAVPWRPVPARLRAERDRALLDAGALAPPLARAAGARGRARPGPPSRRPSLLCAVRGRVDERRAALPRERARCRANTERPC